MTGNPDRELLREYLLGRLDDDEAAELKLSENILVDEELAGVVELVEDEILEDYVEGTLDSADRRAVEEYFLRPPERQRKLRFMETIERHFARKPQLALEGGVRRPQEIHPGRDNSDRVAWWRAPLWTFGAVAAALVLVVVAAGFVAVTHNKETLLQQDLAQEKARSATLTQQVSQLQPPIVVLSLVTSRARGGEREATPHLDIKPSTERIVVEVRVEHLQAGAYQVRLEAQGNETPIWAGTLLPIVSGNGDARLVFDLPVKQLRSDVYSLAVSGPADNGEVKHYDFEATIEK
jgi:anti-sigma factor RsiW